MWKIAILVLPKENIWYLMETLLERYDDGYEIIAFTPISNDAKNRNLIHTVHDLYPIFFLLLTCRY